MQNKVRTSGLNRRIVAFIVMPLFFAVLSYTIVYAIFANSLSGFFDLAKVFILKSNTSDLSDGTYISLFDDEETLKSVVRIPHTPEVSDDDDFVIDLGQLKLPVWGEKYGTISLDGVNAGGIPLYYGDDNAILRKGAGQSTNSFTPGYGRSIIISAHCNSFFAPLESVELGQTVSISTYYGDYVYKINTIEIVSAKDTEKYISYTEYENETLVLYTCYPFTPLFTNRRFVVIAEKISGPELVWG